MPPYGGGMEINMNIIKAYATKNNCYIAAQKMTPKGIVVHSTGANNPTLKRYIDCPEEVGRNIYGNHWNTAKPGGRNVCVHAFIGYDKNMDVRVAEILPLDICCWGVGSGKNGSYNYDPAHIQFEICEDGLEDRIYYDKAFGLAAEYCAHLCRQYGLAVEQIVSHKEAHAKGYGNNHGDPEHWMKNFGEDMNDFRAHVAVLLHENKIPELAEKKEPPEKNCICDGDLVEISDDALYYNGKSVPPWVTSQHWYVIGKPNGDRVVIDKNENGTVSICSAISSKYLTVIRDTATKYPYCIKVKKDILEIYDNDNSCVVIGYVSNKGTYTIVDEKNNRGKLKNGIGWISLDSIEPI